jgi:hypothetical protein
MPTYVIYIPDHIDPGLSFTVSLYNRTHGVSLSTDAWLTQHVTEIAISHDLAAETERLRIQQEKDFEAAMQAVKQRLLDGPQEAMSEMIGVDALRRDQRLAEKARREEADAQVMARMRGDPSTKDSTT